MHVEGIPTSQFFEAVNSWLGTFLPIALIGLGVSLALALIHQVKKAILDAYKDDPQPAPTAEEIEELRRLRQGGFLRRFFSAEQLYRIDNEIERIDATVAREGRDKAGALGFIALASAWDKEHPQPATVDQSNIASAAVRAALMRQLELLEQGRRYLNEDDLAALDQAIEKRKNDDPPVKRKNDQPVRYALSDDGELEPIYDDE